MIIDERYNVFIHSFDTPDSPLIEQLYEEACRQKVPVIRRETQSFLKTILKIKGPSKILEVGAGVGFSAIFMAEYTPKNCSITTIENYKKRIVQAQKNILKSGYSERIRLLEGDAADILKTLDGEYDFIFMDAAKGQYLSFLPDIMRLCKGGGIIVSDNVLQDGNIIESHYLVKRRDRTIYKRMREYLYALKHDEALTTSILPVGDGIALSVKL